MKHNETSSRARLGALSGWVGIECNVLLFGLKLAAGLISGSVAITADAWNNLSDATGSIVTLVGFRLADKPADEHHPYGHARYEYLSALAVSALILAIGLELGKSALDKIIHPTPVDFTWLPAAILLLSIGIKLGLFLFNRHMGKKIGSKTLEAAAIVHDIACPLCREKYGSTHGPYQEAEGAVLAAEFLKDSGLSQSVIDRVVYLVGHHHTYTSVDGADYQILLEADYLVNAEESGYTPEAIRSVRETVFKTAAGTALLDSLYFPE